MCFDQEELLAYLDHEIVGERRWKMEMHLAACKKCQSALDELKEQTESIRLSLACYNDKAQKLNPDTNEAWSKLIERYERENKHSLLKGVGETMSKYMKIAVAAAALILMAGLFSIGAVRSAVADFLSVFRVEKVETVTISRQDLAGLEQAMEKGGKDIHIQNLGDVAVEGRTEMRIVSSEEAAESVDFSLNIPDKALAGYGTPTFRMQPAMKIKFTLDVNKVNTLITSMGGNKLLPQTIDGKTFAINTPAGITAEYPAAAQDSRPLMIAQTRSPEIVVPDGVDVNEIRDALLGLEVLPRDLRQKLAAVNDWQHTMIIPSIEGSSKEVTVNGAKGVFVSSPRHEDRDWNSGALIWPEDGVISVVQGALSLDEAVGIASQMK